MKYKNLSIFLMVFFLLSCKTKEKVSDLNYMQNIEKIAVETAERNYSSTLQTGDQIVILVSAKDKDVANPFNQNYSSGEMVQQAQNNGNVLNQGVIVSGPTYTVDSLGNINFPYIGQLNTTGKTLEVFRDELTDELRKYIKDPTVNIRMANFKITVLGEVNRPGEFIVPNGKATILNALGMAGDTTIYGKRDDILIIRTIDGEITKERINIADANFMNSQFNYLKQGDVIYVTPNATREKTAKLDPNTGLYIGIASIALAAAGIIVTLFKK